jgi:hypothetical protein
MKARTTLSLDQVAVAFRTDRAVLIEFADFGLFPVVESSQGLGIDAHSLEHLERVLGLYRSLGLNKEGIDVFLRLTALISSLRERIEALEASEKEGHAHA